jgi:hypothetical protein
MSATTVNNFLARSAAVLNITKWQFLRLNHKNFEFFVLASKSPTETGLICVKTLEPNISNLGPFKKVYK